MNFRELMKSKEYIYLDYLVEPEENSLRIRIEKCNGVNEKEQLINSNDLGLETFSTIEINKNFPIIQLDFNSYVSYTVTNESFTQMDEYEISEGEMFRIYSKSRFLDFVKLSTFAEVLFPDEPIIHYQVPCLNHIIDITSIEEPKITYINRTDITNSYY